MISNLNRSHLLLLSLSIMLAGNCLASAEQSKQTKEELQKAAELEKQVRSAAGATNSVKLGGESRAYKTKMAPQAGIAKPVPKKANSEEDTDNTSAGAESTPDANTSNVPVQTQTKSSWSTKNYGSQDLKKTARGSKGLVPPPPPEAMGPTITLKTGAKSTKKQTASTSKKLLTVGQATYTLKGQSQEQYATLFDWKPEDTNDKLTLKLNYSDIVPAGKFGSIRWIRVMLGNQLLATDRELRGKTEFIKDMTGTVGSGTNQIVVEAGGAPGAKISWLLTTPIHPKLDKATPDEVVVGDDLTLQGQNFSPIPSKDIVNIAKKQLTPKSASASELKVMIPKDFPPGETEVYVTVDSLNTKAKKVIVRGIPELTGTNFDGIPPGAQLEVYGKNFSKKMQENQVFFGESQGQVVSSSEERITVVVPNFYSGLGSGSISGQVGIPIKVKVGKIESKNTVPISIGNSMWQDPGFRGGPDTPQVPVDWRRLLEN